MHFKGCQTDCKLAREWEREHTCMQVYLHNSVVNRPINGIVNGVDATISSEYVNIKAISKRRNQEGVYMQTLLE